MSMLESRASTVVNRKHADARSNQRSDIRKRFLSKSKRLTLRSQSYRLTLLMQSLGDQSLLRKSAAFNAGAKAIAQCPCAGEN